MLQAKAGPLLHYGYAMPAFEAKLDLAWLNMTPAGAQHYSDGLLLQRIDAGNSRLFGELPSKPQQPLLLQNLVDLHACDWDAIKLSFAAPAAQQQAAVAGVSAAVLSSLLSATQGPEAVVDVCPC
jgi:hypothetical protein